MASLSVLQIEMDVHSSVIDCNWYYGSLFSPKKNVNVEANLSVGVSDHDFHHPIAEDEESEDAGDLKGLRRESSNSTTNLCFGSGNSDQAEKCKEYEDETETEYLERMFRVLDEDGDGRVSVHEIITFLKRLNLEMPKEEVELAVRSVSASGSEFLVAMEFEELYRIIFIEKEEETDSVKAEENAIYEAFAVFDQNRDGFISAMELADVLRRLGFVEGKDVNCCQSMIESVDFNGDGLVDIHEFKHLITRNSTSPPYPCLQCVAFVK